MRFLAIFLFFLFGGFAAAADVSGERDPAFQAALADWLDGSDDIGTLHRLAALARGGNTAARMVLGLIERNAAHGGHLMDRLDRDDRRAIFRDPDGPFGRPWLRVAANTNAYAAVRAAPMSPENIPIAYAAAIAAEDLRFAWELAMIGFNHSGSPGAAARLAHPSLMPHSSAVLAWMLAMFDQSDRETDLSPEEQASVVEMQNAIDANPVPENLMPALSTPLHRSSDLQAEPAEIRRIGAASLKHPSLEPLASVVESVCPEDTALHMGMLTATRSLFPLTLLQSSPLVPLVDDATWQDSARFGPDTLREIMVFPANRALLEQRSPCLWRATE